MDLVTKAWILGMLDPWESLPIIPGAFHLTHVQNPGAAFGLGAGLGSLFIPLYILTLLILTYLGLSWGRQNRLASVGIALLAGGVAGNLVDRIRFGHVVDFLDFRVWPVFNVADAALTVGAILLAVMVWREGFG